jgi:hypothetical protein
MERLVSENPYSRIYWSVMDDPKFDGIREDARVFGSWVLLLIYADLAYPAPTYRPPFVPAAAFKRLVAVGLVDDLPGKRYRIHGLASDRDMRSHYARNAAAKRWQSEGIRDVDARKEKKRIEEKSAGAHEDAPAFRREFAPSRPKVSTVDRDPHLRELRAALLAKEKES